ncbi:hypothetical protein [Pleomorphomonas sp. PLEO]|uniref:hypothetical protein n=1 Tax=Pleomorphomonas sp. PLEO TaxID=3239306 RepID=UPI00351E1F05
MATVLKLLDSFASCFLVQTIARMLGQREDIMLIYLVGVSFISVALGACFAFVGGLIVLMLLIFFSSGVLICFLVSADFSALSIFGICFVSIVFMNLGWFGAVIVGSLHGLFTVLREQIFLKTGRL